MQRPRHHAIARDGFNGCEEHARESQSETCRSEIIVSESREADAADQGDHGPVDLTSVVAVVDPAVDEDGHDGDGGAEDLVEGDGDEAAFLGGNC